MCWGEHTRRQSCPKILNILSDFSAVLDHDFQDRLNCAIPAHSNQDVFIVSHSPRHIEIGEGICHRIQENNVWNIFAATGTGQKLKANYFFPTVAVIHILNYYRFFFLQSSFHAVCMFTDGCASEYKSRRNTRAVGYLAVLFRLAWFICLHPLRLSRLWLTARVLFLRIKTRK
jgi:hypothetical protein